MPETPDPSVTERIARAIYEASPLLIYPQDEGVGAPDVVLWEQLHEHERVPLLNQARAALSFMPSLEEENARLREALRNLLNADVLNPETLHPHLARRRAEAALSPRKEDQ